MRNTKNFHLIYLFILAIVQQFCIFSAFRVPHTTPHVTFGVRGRGGALERERRCLSGPVLCDEGGGDVGGKRTQEGRDGSFLMLELRLFFLALLLFLAQTVFIPIKL